ncbi:hypothetical protein CCH79_00003483 [Gambusia affinis]|uniref:Ion transport domain-containing protein n=1 Tax=Gambusia affinis TaxID=33528 RepID=A0A315VDY7_GAMAF|nr:hypothetical protein CCH79_00003483 [Gambusia affinis]
MVSEQCINAESQGYLQMSMSYRGVSWALSDGTLKGTEFPACCMCPFEHPTPPAATDHDHPPWWLGCSTLACDPSTVHSTTSLLLHRNKRTKTLANLIQPKMGWDETGRFALCLEQQFVEHGRQEKNKRDEDGSCIDLQSASLLLNIETQAVLPIGLYLVALFFSLLRPAIHSIQSLAFTHFNESIQLKYDSERSLSTPEAILFSLILARTSPQVFSDGRTPQPAAQRFAPHDWYSEAQSKPYYSDYSPTRLLIHKMCTSHYLDLFITIVIGLNVITMSMEHYEQPQELDNALKICNYIFTLIFVLESVFKLVAFGFRRFFKDKWNQLDLAIVLLSIMGITLEEIEVNASLPINPTIIRIMRVLRIARGPSRARVEGEPTRWHRETHSADKQSTSKVGNLGLLFMLLFFIFAALGVELFGDLICDELHPCEGLGRYATFRNFGMAFLLLFRVSTGDNWNGIMKDTLRDCAHETGTCYNTVVSPIYFVSFVLTAQFVLVNVVIAVLMKHLEESNKEAKEEAELEAELNLELQMEGADMAPRSPQLNPLALGMDRSSSGGSPWRSAGGGDMVQEREGPMDSPTADITRDFVDIRAEPPAYPEPQLERRPLFDSISLVIQGSVEGELSLMDNLSGSICHYYALPPRPNKHSTDKKIPLAEMEALSLASEKSWSLALPDDSAPDDFSPLFLSALDCNVLTVLLFPPLPSLFPVLRPAPEAQKDNLLSVRKPAVGRTHSLPNDSYMFFPLQPFGSSSPSPAQLVAQSQGPQHLVGTHRAHSGSRGSVRSQPEECSQQLTVPTDFFRPISPHSHSDSESVPRQPPSRRTHALSRTLRRQVAVSTDSQEALCSDELESSEGLLNAAALGLPPSVSPPHQHHHPHLHPALCLVPATPGASPKPSSQQQEEVEAASEDHEVSLITCGGLVGSDSVAVEDTVCQESRSPCTRQLKRFHSVDTQGRSTLLPRPRPYSWLDDPRRHSVEVYQTEDPCPQRSAASTSSGFVSRSDSLQIPTQGPLPSPRRKKKMSPPCISVDPPDELEPQSGLYPSLSGMGLVGLGMPPPLPSRDTCLRRRAPSSDSKDSFDLGVGEGLGQDGGSPNPNPSSKLLTLPSFSFEKTSSEH